VAYIEHGFPIERLNQITTRESNAKKPIYQIHKWWARRLGSVFRMLILATFAEDDITEAELWPRFYSKNDLGGKIVLDPFMGGGTTVVEALRLGCRVIGIDLNPVAWFVTKKEIEPVNLDDLDAAFEHLKKTVAPQITNYYKTTCPKCQEEADVMYVFWVKKVPCLNCGEEVLLFPSFRIASRKGVHTIFCPDCYQIQQTDDLDAETACDECGAKFTPSKGYSSRGKYTCPSCGQKNRVLDAVRRGEGPPVVQMFAVEYHCPRDGRGYKRAEAEDRDLFGTARVEFERRKDELPFPRQKVPHGLKTRELLNHKYEYFYQMFNERQLLCLSMLLEQILKIEDENLREFMVLTFSDTLNASNMFAKYHKQYRKIEPLFGHHAYWPVSIPVENNLWGTKFGKNTFVKEYRKTRKAKEYNLAPFERSVDSVGNSRKHYVGDQVQGSLASDACDFGDSNTILWAKTAEDLSRLPPGSVDAVVTDPPYCDNVMYAELADFFYVWLRLALKDQYACFEPEYSPRAREIVKNQAQGKDDEFFFKGLTRVFSECRRVLRDDGLMVFTFHHRQPSVWTSLLQALVDAAFYVCAVYPVHAEAPSAIRDLGNIRYDIPFVCRKRLEPGPPVSWTSLKDQIHVEARRLLRKLRDPDRDIAEADLSVITMGKGLELYTKHYPNVLKNGERVKVQDAVSDINRIVETLVKDFELRQLPANLDQYTRMFALYLVGRKEISFDDLNIRIQVGGGDADEVFDLRFVEREGSSLRVLSPVERREFIDGMMSRGKPLAQIDKIHYLYDQYTQKRSIRPHLKEWASSDLQAVCDLLYRKTGDETYKSLAQQIEQFLRTPEGQLDLGV